MFRSGWVWVWDASWLSSGDERDEGRNGFWHFEPQRLDLLDTDQFLRHRSFFILEKRMRVRYICTKPSVMCMCYVPDYTSIELKRNLTIRAMFWLR